MRIVGSIGLPNWDLPTCLAIKHEIPVDLVIAQHATTESELRVRAETYLGCALPDTWRFLGPEIDCTVSKPKQLWLMRDDQVVEMADVLIPVSVRPKGKMHDMIEAAGRDSRIERSFEVAYQRRTEKLAYHTSSEHLNPDLREFHREYLVHYTRGCNGPWPDETVVDYYSAIITSHAYPRNALATLTHIAQMGKIIGSSRHMPENLTCVSFTALPVSEALSLMRWRARYRQMSLEPYGVAVRRSAAERLGLRPVVYYDSSQTKPGSRDIWRWQSTGVKTDWRAEQEWRVIGNVCLTEIPANCIALLCHTPAEARLVEGVTGYKSFPIVV